MSPSLLLLIGMLIVVVGIIGLRVHPFVALITAALAVAFLTPEDSIYRSALDSDERAALFPADIIAVEINSGGAELDGRAVAVVGAHQDAVSKSESWFVSRVTSAFGGGCGKIAIIIAMAAIIGKCLLDSGAARRIVEALMALFGVRRTPIAFAMSAFTIGIPVFFDTVFYLLMPLGRALRVKTGKDYLLYILTIVAGATMAHSLVPPTPGPLTVAGFFGDEVSIGSMMIGGLLVGMVTVTVGVLYAHWANKRWEIPLRDMAGHVSGEGDSGVDESQPMPALWLSLLPIILPIGLIGGYTAHTALGGTSEVFRFLGDKNLALILAAGVSILLLIYSKRRQKGEISAAVQDALASGGVIILVTAAGSAFGAVLRDTGIADTIGGIVPSGKSLFLIPIAYLVTALVRTAQGSATVAMITAGGIVAPIALATDLSYSALYLALAIGCGSKPISWANDSGFWVIGRMSGMTPMETFKSVSVMMILMSLAGLIVVFLGALLFPMA